MPTGTSQADAVAYGRQVGQAIGNDKVLVIFHNVEFLGVEKMPTAKANDLLKVYDEAIHG